MLKTITFPKYFSFNIKATKKGFPLHNGLIGGDVETREGEPICFQLFTASQQKFIIWCNKYNCWDKIVEALSKIKLKADEKDTTVFFHNLSHDFVALLYPYHQEFETQTYFELLDPKKKWFFKIWCGKRYFGMLYILDGIDRKTKKYKIRRSFKIVDSGGFFKYSLNQIMQDIFPGEKKLEAPELLGEKVFTARDIDFVKYAEHDAYLEYKLADYIVQMHKEYDIPVSVSVAQMAQRIFTRKFVPNGITIKPLPKAVQYHAVLSYHGGKNGFYLDKPQVIENVYELDFTSNYPSAMHQLPAWTSGKIIQTEEIAKEIEGLYCVSGYVKKCKYPCLCTHDFKYISGIYVNDLWITSYELKEALRMDEIQLDKVHGEVWQPAKEATNPLQDYVEHFFKLKSECKDSRRLLYKTLLNSLYGKFIQTTKVDQVDVECNVNEELKIISSKSWPGEYKAGGLFNPFIATLITGYSRAKLHALEHKYNALDSATDAIKTTMIPDQSDLSKELGGLQIAHFGHCLFIRNKLYVHIGEEKTKYALHGFRGNISDLLRLYMTKEKEYSYMHFNQIRESLVRNLKPLKRQCFIAELNVEW